MTERPDGFYWVKWVKNYGEWGVAETMAGEWWLTRIETPIRGEPFQQIGPRLDPQED